MNVILDIDIGYDISSTWALNLLLSSNLFDVKLISVNQGDVDYQVSIVAKILKLLNKENIPIARGESIINKDDNHPQKCWIEEFDLSTYDGIIFNSYKAAYEEVLSSNSDVTVVALASLKTLLSISTILKKYNPKIVAITDLINTGRFVFNEVKDYNITSNIDASLSLLLNNLNITLIPANICEKIVIFGDNYRKIRNSSTIKTKIICENYEIWQEEYKGKLKKFDINSSSSVLYDLAPILYLLFPQNFETVKKHHINIVLNIHKTGGMLRFVAEQYCTNFSYNHDIKKLEVEGMYSLTYVLKKCNVLLSVIEYGWEAHKPGSSYGPSVRDYYILHFITKGKGRLVVDGKEFVLKKGDCFLLPPKLTTYYETNKKNPYTYYWVGFDGIEAKELLEKSGLIINNNYVIHPKNYNAMFEKFSSFEITTSDDFVVPYQLLGKLYMLFSEIMRKEIETVKEKSNYVDLAIKYMNLNYSKNISVESMAKIVGVDRTYFYRIFKETTKHGPKEYLSNLRLEKAKMLLCNSQMNIKEIALSVGFNNYLAFERLFKEKCGVNPTEYRKKNT